MSGIVICQCWTLALEGGRGLRGCLTVLFSAGLWQPERLVSLSTLAMAPPVRRRSPATAATVTRPAASLTTAAVPGDHSLPLSTSHRRSNLSSGRSGTSLPPISLPPPTIIKLVGNKLSCRFMTKRLREKDEEDMTISDWKFAAMVIDRFCLIGLTIYTVLTTMIMFISAPHLIVK